MKVTDTFTGGKVPKGTKFLYPAGTICRDAAYQLVSLFFLTFVQFCAPLGYGWEWNIASGAVRNDALYYAQMGVITAIIVVLKIWDGFNDPIMGWIIEKTHFKTGKYKPWILIGGVTNAIVIYLMFTLRPVGWFYVIAFGLFYLLWDFTFTMNDIGYWSMLPSLSSEEKERNDITTLVSICASVGAFAAGGIIPMVVAGNAVQTYSIIALIIAIAFALSQVILFFFCKEHARDDGIKEEEAKFTDMFKILKNNSQVRITTIVMCVYYIGSAVLNGFGLNYFYYIYGYGTGGSIMTYFTVAYALGTIIAQCLFPILIKKFNRAQLFKFSFFVLLIGYIIFFFYDLPLNNEGLVLGFSEYVKAGTGLKYLDIAILSLLGIFIFAGEGIFYLILIVMMTNTIEYNEYTTGERKEAVIFSLRPLTAKISSAVMNGVTFIGLSATALYSISSGISDLEVKKGLGEITENEVISGADKLIANINFNQLIWLKFFMCIVPLILFIVSYLLIKKFYIIDEKYYKNMCDEIVQKKVAEENKE